MQLSSSSLSNFPYKSFNKRSEILNAVGQWWLKTTFFHVQSDLLNIIISSTSIQLQAICHNAWPSIGLKPRHLKQRLIILWNRLPWLNTSLECTLSKKRSSQHLYFRTVFNSYALVTNPRNIVLFRNCVFPFLSSTSVSDIGLLDKWQQPQNNICGRATLTAPTDSSKVWHTWSEKTRCQPE